MVTTGCTIEEMVIISFHKLFNSNNRFNIAIFESTLKETIYLHNLDLSLLLLLLLLLVDFLLDG